MTTVPRYMGVYPWCIHANNTLEDSATVFRGMTLPYYKYQVDPLRRTQDHKNRSFTLVESIYLVRIDKRGLAAGSFGFSAAKSEKPSRVRGRRILLENRPVIKAKGGGPGATAVLSTGIYLTSDCKTVSTTALREPSKQSPVVRFER